MTINIRNINRIEKEITRYDYNILNNAYYFLPKAKYNKIQLEESIILNKPIHGAIINAPCLDCGNRRPEMKTAQLTIREEGRKDAKAKLIINR